MEIVLPVRVKLFVFDSDEEMTLPPGWEPFQIERPKTLFTEAIYVWARSK